MGADRYLESHEHLRTEHDALCKRFRALTDRFAQTEAMCIALEIMLKRTLEAIDRANRRNVMEHKDTGWYEPELDQDTLDWWAKHRA